MRTAEVPKFDSHWKWFFIGMFCLVLLAEHSLGQQRYDLVILIALGLLFWLPLKTRKFAASFLSGVIACWLLEWILWTAQATATQYAANGHLHPVWASLFKL